eukprot:10001804-Prorocentrum_lima.AAC.1
MVWWWGKGVGASVALVEARVCVVVCRHISRRWRAGWPAGSCGSHGHPPVLERPRSSGGGTGG